MKIGCPKCYWATDDVDIMIGKDDIGFIIRCNKCKAAHHLKIPMISCGELVPA